MFSSIETEPVEGADSRVNLENGLPNKGTERQDMITGNWEITFRNKYNLEVLPANVADIEELLGNVLESEVQHDQADREAILSRIEKTDGFVKSDAMATEEIETAEKSNEQLVVEDDRKVRDLFLQLVNQMDVWPNTAQKKIRKLTDSGSKFVFSEFVVSFKNSDQNLLGDNVKDHWATEQNCFVISDATASEIIKTFDSINDKARYGYQLNGQNEDVMVLNLNGLKRAFIIDGGHRREDEDDLPLAA